MKTLSDFWLAIQHYLFQSKLGQFKGLGLKKFCMNFKITVKMSAISISLLLTWGGCWKEIITFHGKPCSRDNPVTIIVFLGNRVFLKMRIIILWFIAKSFKYKNTPVYPNGNGKLLKDGPLTVQLMSKAFFGNPIFIVFNCKCIQYEWHWISKEREQQCISVFNLYHK